MVSFVVTSFLLAGFLLVMAGFVFWFGSKAPQKWGGLPIRSILFVNVIMYVGLAHLAAFSAVGYSVEDTVTAPCENVINESSEFNSTVTQYTYQDTCQGETAADITLKSMMVFNFAVQIMFLQLFLLSFYWGWRVWKSRW